MAMTRAPLAKLLAKSDSTFADSFTYQDYLYELLADGSSERPVTEQQWEMICDMIGSRTLIYASSVKWAINNLETKENAS